MKNNEQDKSQTNDKQTAVIKILFIKSHYFQLKYVWVIR